MWGSCFKDIKALLKKKHAERVIPALDSLSKRLRVCARRDSVSCGKKKNLESFIRLLCVELWGFQSRDIIKLLLFSAAKK